MTLRALEDPAQRCVQLWIRILYGLSNLILAFLGKGGLAVSIIIKLSVSGDLILLDHYHSINTNVFLAGSLVLIVISWLGIFAGSKKCYKSTMANAALLGSFLVSTTVFTVTTGILTDYTQKGDLYIQMEKDMKNYNHDTSIVDNLHTELSCCGLNDITTWINKIPASCCRNKETNCVLGSYHLQTNGCFKEFIRISRYYSLLIYSVLLFAGVIEIFAIMLSCMQCYIIRDTQQKKHRTQEETEETAEDLKIPNSQVHVEDETQNNEEDKEKLEEEKKEEGNRKEEGEKKEQNEAKKENEKEKIDKEKEGKEKKGKDKEKKEKKKEKANKKETEKVESLDKKEKFEEAKQNVEKMMQEKKDNDEKESKKEELAKENEEAKQDTHGNVHTDTTSAHKNMANIVVNIY